MKNNNFFKSDEDIEAEATLLFGIPKDNPFEVPPDYFDQLSVNIQNRVIIEGVPRPMGARIVGFAERILSNLIRPKFAIGIASVLVLIAAGFFYLHHTSKPNAVKITAEEATSSGFIESIDVSELEDEVVSSGCLEKRAEEIDLDKEQIKDYLLQNQIDDQIITSEL